MISIAADSGYGCLKWFQSVRYSIQAIWIFSSYNFTSSFSCCSEKMKKTTFKWWREIVYNTTNYVGLFIHHTTWSFHWLLLDFSLLFRSCWCSSFVCYSAFNCLSNEIFDMVFLSFPWLLCQSCILTSFFLFLCDTKQSNHTHTASAKCLIPISFFFLSTKWNNYRNPD